MIQITIFCINTITWWHIHYIYILQYILPSIRPWFMKGWNIWDTPMRVLHTTCIQSKKDEATLLRTHPWFIPKSWFTCIPNVYYLFHELICSLLLHVHMYWDLKIKRLYTNIYTSVVVIFLCSNSLIHVSRTTVIGYLGKSFWMLGM